MTDSSLPRPTNAELEILQVLWDQEVATVREVWQKLSAHREKAPGYTTVLKLMQIMAEKGLLVRDERDRAHVYRPGLPREEAQRNIVSNLVDRVFAGSASELIIHALAGRQTSPEEIQQLREWLDQYESDLHEKANHEKGRES